MNQKKMFFRYKIISEIWNAKISKYFYKDNAGCKAVYNLYTLRNSYTICDKLIKNRAIFS